MNITNEPLPFAQGSYKKVFNIMPAKPTSSVVFINPDDNVEKIITKTSVYFQHQPVASKKAALETALSELELQMLFYSVELAPRIYAIQFISLIMVDKKPVSTKHTYYLDSSTTIDTIHSRIMSQLSFNDDYLQMIVLTASCEKEYFSDLIGAGKPIENMEKALELIHTFIKKLVYHNYWFLDFKPGNFCVMLNPTPHVIGLDFDRNFIIDINQVQTTLSKDTLRQVASTYMFVLAVLNLQYDLSLSEKQIMQRIIRTRHLKATHISELVRTLVELEKTGHNLCKTKYNPLSMLAYYVLPVVNISSADVLNCNILAKPISTLSKGFSNNTPTYDFIKIVIAENVFGLGEYNNEKGGTDYLKAPYVSAEFNTYIQKIEPLRVKPLIQPALQTISMPMFGAEPAQEPPAPIPIPMPKPTQTTTPVKEPPAKKYKISAEGGAKKRITKRKWKKKPLTKKLQQKTSAKKP